MSDNSGLPSRVTIQSYEQIRKLLRLIFLYRCYNRTEITEILGISDRTYKNNIALLRQYLPPDTFLAKSKDRMQVFEIASGMFTTSYNTLFSTYQTKAFRRFHFDLAFLYLQKLQKQTATLDELKRVGDTYLEDVIDERSLKACLKELVTLGYVIQDEGKQSSADKSTKRRKSASYCLAPDIIGLLSPDGQRRLREAADFFRNICYPATCGSWLFDTVSCYMGEPAYESPFRIRDNHYSHVLDDEILWKLLTAIDTGKTVSFGYRSQKGTLSKAKYAHPLFVIAEEQYDRRRLIAKTDGIRSFRLDRVEELRIDEDTPKEEASSADKAEASKRCSRCSKPDCSKLAALTKDEMAKYVRYGTETLNTKLQTLTLLAYDEQAAFSIRSRFCVKHETARPGDATEFEIEYGNPVNLRPWLRQNLKRITLLACSQQKFMNDFSKELKTWREMYGILPRNEEQMCASGNHACEQSGEGEPICV